MLAVWVVPSIDMSASAMPGKALLTMIVATPRAALKLGSCGLPRGSVSEGIMNTLCSVPAASPSCARLAFVSALLFVMN